MSALIKIKAGREKPIANRHPWIFSGAINSVKGTPAPGDIVTVIDHRDRFLGRGYWNGASQIQVRLLTWADEEIDQDWWYRLLKRAVDSRTTLRRSTNACRLINGENDYLPGLIVDQYGDWLVLQALTLGIDIRKWQIAEMLQGLVSTRGLFERSDVDIREREGLSAATAVLVGELPPEFIEIDEGPRVLVDVHRGHKTGFYLDQRGNRQLTGQLAHDLPAAGTLLNLFSYTGGFSLHSLSAPGLRVINVDSSADALALAEQNTILNQYDPERAEYHQADVFQWLRDPAHHDHRYDIIVLDPPKFAQGKRQVEGACRGYKDLNLNAFRLVKPGGHLLTFSCSGAISADLFQKVVFGALADSGREAQIIRQLGPGEDHPIALTFPEGAYLKGLLLRVF